MIVVLSMVAAIWGIGWALGAPAIQRWVMIGVLLAAVIVAQLLLPEGHPLRQATGGDARLWLLLIGFAAIGAGYRRILRRLRARSQSKAAVDEKQNGQSSEFTETEINRYARHMILREVGGVGQRRLKTAKVLVIGAGGLGSPALMYLAAAGVGTIGIVDDDVVDGSNLQRQIIHRDGHIGMPKVHSAEIALRELNPFVTVRPYNRRLTEEISHDLMAEYDLVLDGTDNFGTRYLINRAAARAGKPLVSAAISQWEGQISLFDPAQGDPCYECIFPEAPADGLAPTCAEAGVVGPLPGVLGSLMAVEAVKAITGAGECLRGRMMIYDALYSETRLMKIKPRADCPVCGSPH